MSNIYITLEGLHKWYVSLFERVGWKLLSKRDGLDHKIYHFKMEIDNLLQALDRRMEATEEKDRLIDLAIMKKNTEYLREQVELLFPSDEEFPVRGGL